MNKKTNSISLAHAFALMSLLWIAACAAPRVKIESEPMGVDVFVSNPGSRELKPLGKTPFDITFAELNQRAKRAEGDSNNLVLLTFESKETETQKILVPLVSIGLKSIELKVPLDKKQEDKSSVVILQHLHNAQKFAQSGEFERAHIECDKVLEINPQLVRAISTKASIYYVQRKLENSEIWYEKALAIDPSFDEAIQMISKIKQEKR